MQKKKKMQEDLVKRVALGKGQCIRFDVKADATVQRGRMRHPIVNMQLHKCRGLPPAAVIYRCSQHCACIGVCPPACWRPAQPWARREVARE